MAVKSIHKLFDSASDDYIEQFLERWDENIDRSGDCHEWTGHKIQQGYGHTYFNGVNLRVHRVSLYLHEREPIVGSDVLHSCHNRACVNPAHLRRGDDSSNQIDALKVGRHNNQSLTIDDVKEIKQRYSEDDITQTELGDEYGVGQDQISRIVNGKRWEWV